MTAENEHKLSIQLLSNVALGRGSQIALDIVFIINILYYFNTYFIPIFHLICTKYIINYINIL